MAECHPVGFRWAMKARERGATIIHVDPRFSRTSAMADLHVPIRAGSDIAFLGGLIRYVLDTDSYFKEYVLNYTNAATLVNEDFKGPEDLGGFFSGWDPETKKRIDGVESRRIVLVTDLGFLVKDAADGTHDVFVVSVATGTPDSALSSAIRM